MNTPTIDQVKTYAAQVARGAKLASIDSKALHTYRDKDGTPLYWRVRLKCHSTGDKFIRPFMWNGTAFEAKEPPAPDAGKPLYGLERLATHQEAVAIICEGENCVDSLYKTLTNKDAVDVVALTSGGASSAQAANWAHLAERRVVIFPDNDKAGLKYAADVVECLQGIAASVKVFDIALLNLPAKGDCVDWLKAFQLQYGRKATAADILALPVIDYAPQKVDVSGSDSSSFITSGEALPLPECVAQADKPAEQADEVIKALAKLTKLEYEKVRQEKAKALGFRSTVLDDLVKAERSRGSGIEGGGKQLPFNEVEPCPEPIDPAQLLSEVSDTIRKFIVLDTEQAHAAALWVAFTWFIDVVEVAPLAIINAPEKACGKTQLRNVMGYMCKRYMLIEHATASTLFRAVELWKPTILIDEADTFFKEMPELHGMVNAGHAKGGTFLVNKPVGDDWIPYPFPVFCAKAIAGIALEKHLPDATMSRGIVFNLRRKLAHESVSRLRHADINLFAGIAEKLARFAVDYSQQVRQARPTLPDALSDRDQDNWEGLLAIASCAGDEWLARATTAALKLSGAGEKTVSTGNELLADIQHVFDLKREVKISFTELIKALCEDEEAGWATYNRGKQITPRQVSKRLKEYGISSKPLRFGYDGVQKGFDLDQFDDVFARYLKNPDFPVTQLQPNNCAASDVTNGKAVTVTQSNLVTPKPSNGADCNHVTGKSPILEGVL